MSTIINTSKQLIDILSQWKQDSGVDILGVSIYNNTIKLFTTTPELLVAIMGKYTKQISCLPRYRDMNISIEPITFFV